MKKSEAVNSVLETIFYVPVTLSIAMAMLVLIFFLFFNGLGLLFGFEKNSDGCVHYQEKKQTNLEYYAFPITRYACKENGGLLQPATGHFVDWLGKKHE